jgi:hypothetical protein
MNRKITLTPFAVASDGAVYANVTHVRGDVSIMKIIREARRMQGDPVHRHRHHPAGEEGVAPRSRQRLGPSGREDGRPPSAPPGATAPALLGEVAMKVLRVIRIETAPGGAVHLVTEGGDRVIVTRRTDGYSAARVGERHRAGGARSARPQRRGPAETRRQARPLLTAAVCTPVRPGDVSRAHLLACRDGV